MSHRETPAFAILRFDAFQGAEAPPEQTITVKSVVHSLDDAEDEVERLNAQAPAGARYFWQATRIVDRQRDASG